MARQIEEIEKELFELSTEDRARVVRDLIASLDHDEQQLSPEEWESAWKAELLKRQQDLVTGKSNLMPGDEVFRQARKRLKT